MNFTVSLRRLTADEKAGNGPELTGVHREGVVFAGEEEKNR